MDMVARTTALYLGTKPETDGVTYIPGPKCVLIEIVEALNIDGYNVGFGYIPHNLDYEETLEVKTIGSMSFELMVQFVQNQFQGRSWRRLR